jgi:DNA-binding transcriptional LysR family regulator
MLVRHLSFFVTLAREKHFARAAAACHVTQPTLSAAIRKLEDDLQIRLVVRGHRYLGLTPEGARVLDWARQILTDYDGLRADLSDLKKGLSGTLRLGVIPAAMPCVSFLTARFCAAHPSATIDIQSMTSRSIQRGLDTFEIDAGITYLDNEPIENVRRFPLYRERYVFVTNAGSRHAGREMISWKEAARERLCLLSDDMQNRRILNNIAGSIGLTVKPIVVSNSFLAVCSHISQGDWSSIVPHTFVHVFGRSQDLAMVELSEPEHSQAIGLVLSNRDPLAPMASALIAAMLGADFEAEFVKAEATTH